MRFVYEMKMKMKMRVRCEVDRVLYFNKKTGRVTEYGMVIVAVKGTVAGINIT